MDRWASSTPFTERAVDYEIEGDDGTFGTYETKKAAVAAGREQAMKRKTEHVIHSLDGVISERNSSATIRLIDLVSSFLFHRRVASGAPDQSGAVA